MSVLGARLARRLIALLVLVAAALNMGHAVAGPPTLVAQGGVTAPGSIAELARALKYDPDLIYEYVYTNIAYSPTSGVKKGALGTLLDGAGNDMDQAVLMAALLRQSGFTVSYVVGRIQLTPNDVATYLGTDPGTFCNAAAVLSNGGIDFQYPDPPPADCATPPAYFYLLHTWLTVTGGSFGGNVYVYDPSYKHYTTAVAGMNIATAIGYDASDFLTAAKSGSTPGTNSIQGLNTTNIQSKLTGYANKLVDTIKTNNPTATTNDVIGGRYIQPLSQPFQRQTSLSYEKTGDNPTVYPDDVPPYRTYFEILIGGINVAFWSDQLYGHRLSVVYNASNQPQLFIDGTLFATGTANASTLYYGVEFPFCFLTTGPTAPGCPSGSTNVFITQSTIQPSNGFTYAIVNGWDFTGRGIVDFHRRQLEAAKATGASNTSEAVLGEALNMVGYSWLAQFSASAALNDRLIGSKVVFQCAFGVVGQAYGPYIDMPGVVSGSSGLSATAGLGVTAALSTANAGSALEWGTLDQNFINAGMGAISTIKVMDIANTGNDTFYDTTSTNWTTVQGNLSNYATADINDIYNNYVSKGFRVILPKHGNQTDAGWTGAAYVAHQVTSTTFSFSYLISHNLKGAYPITSFDAFGVSLSSLATWLKIFDTPTVLSAEPIDLFSGAYLYDRDDLIIGSAGFPIGLGFTRSYNSYNLYTKGPLGAGWTHNFAITALINSDGLRGLGLDSPIDGAAAIAASYVVQDLMSDPARPLDKMVIAALVQKWLMTKLINNTVNVTIGSQVEQFVLLADGSYNPRLGSSNRLTLSGGVYTFTTKDGTTLTFDAIGNIATWQNTSGVTISFAYDASTPPRLTTVSNNLGRSLTLAYNGLSQLASVTDNASPPRSVTYAYDGNGNLASATDPLGQATTYAYASIGGSQPPSLLSQIFYPANPTSSAVTNSYDSLGRVSAQTNANGATWNYYFAGYRSEEDDAYGTQHVLYYNPRGLPLFDIQDYAGQGLTTSMLYDGLDRPAQTTLPEGGQTLYSYASTNAWANNVSQIERKPKPGPALASLITAYTYDSTFNKPTLVTDPRGLVTTMSYDAATGNLLTVVADAGTSPHFNATTTSTYNSIGLPLTIRNPIGVFTQYAYDSFGNRTAIIADANTLRQTTAFAYDSIGNATSITDPRGNVITSTWDANRRQLTTTSPGTPAAPSGLVTANSYDANGQIVQVRRSAGASLLTTTDATYTLTGKTATTTDAKGNVTSYTYDLLDRLTSITDPMNRVTQFTYTVLGQPYRTYNTGIQFTPLLEQAWTADGLRASLKDANGNTTGFSYDRFDRPVTTTYPGGSTETATWDADANMLTRTTRAGTTLRYGYDTLNRLVTKTAAASPVTCNATASSTPTVTYSYDLAGRVTGVCDNSAAISAIAAPSNTIAYSTSYSYDAMNRPTGITFDPVPTPTLPSTASAISFDFGYNAANQRTSMAASDNAWIDYPAGPTGSTSYAANNLNQYTAVGAANPSYDGNGNLTSDGTYSFGYDTENRLTTASKAGMTAVYAFDAQGRRKRKSVNGTTTIFVTDADNREVLEYDAASGAIQRWYAYGLGPNDVLGQMNIAASTRSTPVADLLGSIVGVMDASAGTLTSFAYRPYGANASPPSQFGYTGQRVDAEDGLYYYRARHYSPAWGRFLQIDPIGDAGGINQYAYAANNPLNLLDPFGFNAEGSGGGSSSGAGFTASRLRNYFSDFGRDLVDTPSRMASDVGRAADDLVTDFPLFLRKAGGALAGLGMSIPIGRVGATVSETRAWALPPTVRGLEVERMLGGNLPANFPVIDVFQPSTGVATSIKSIDLGAATYQNTAVLYGKLSSYVNSVAEFAGASYGGVTIAASAIVSRVLTIAIPNAGTVAQQQVLQQVIQVGIQRGVTVNVVTVR